MGTATKEIVLINEAINDIKNILKNKNEYNIENSYKRIASIIDGVECMEEITERLYKNVDNAKLLSSETSKLLNELIEYTERVNNEI